MDNCFSKKFGDVKGKIQRYMRIHARRKNRKRRFRSKRSEAEAKSHVNQETIRFKVMVYTPAVLQEPQFSGQNLSSEDTVPKEGDAAGFQRCPDALGSVEEGHDINKYPIHGGAKGIAENLFTSISNGISSSDQWLNKRKETDGINRFTESRRLLMARVSENSDDLIRQLVADLESCSIGKQKKAALEIRLLAENKSENCIKIVEAGAIKPLISLISSSDHQLQECAVTAILNLLCDELMALSGAIKPLVRALETGTSTTKENAARALLYFSKIEDKKNAIGQLGGIPHLVNLLENGGFRRKKDTLAALCYLCEVEENKTRAIQAGIMKPLVELMADFGSNMADKSVYAVSLLISLTEGKTSLVENGGIPVVVQIIKEGSQLEKEIAVAILLRLCKESVVYRTMVALEGAIPPLVALSQSSTNGAKQKAETLLQLLGYGDPAT